MQLVSQGFSEETYPVLDRRGTTLCCNTQGRIRRNIHEVSFIMSTHNNKDKTLLDENDFFIFFSLRPPLISIIPEYFISPPRNRGTSFLRQQRSYIYSTAGVDTVHAPLHTLYHTGTVHKLALCLC